MLTKKIRNALSLLGVAFGLAAMPAQAEVTLRFAHYSPESHAIHKAAVQFAAKVDERTKGQVKITLFPNNTLG
ncbi:MAG: C4-dicarboxylate ABC transporter substrate-binding protein, partial [Ramlibacter sp.]